LGVWVRVRGRIGVRVGLGLGNRLTIQDKARQDKARRSEAIKDRTRQSKPTPRQRSTQDNTTPTRGLVRKIQDRMGNIAILIRMLIVFKRQTRVKLDRGKTKTRQWNTSTVTRQDKGKRKTKTTTTRDEIETGPEVKDRARTRQDKRGENTITSEEEQRETETKTTREENETGPKSKTGRGKDNTTPKTITPEEDRKLEYLSLKYTRQEKAKTKTKTIGQRTKDKRQRQQRTRTKDKGQRTRTRTRTRTKTKTKT
jgi:hypothetical protein